MKESDTRALALVIFQHLRKQIPILQDSRTARARDIIAEAIQLLPDYRAKKTDRDNILLIQRMTDPPDEFIAMNIQDAIDSLTVLWRDYQSTLDRSPEIE